MVRMSSIEQLIHSIDGRIQRLNGDITSLQNARSALLSNGSNPRPARNPRAKRTARPKASRANEVLLADNAERMLAENDGQTTASLAKRAGADRNRGA
jgi:hypothetical protein